MRHAPVALQVAWRHGVAETRQVGQEFRIQAGRIQHCLQTGLPLRVVGKHFQHGGILVAHQEFDGAVLQRLEARGSAQRVTEFHVFRRRQGFQHRPLLGQLAQHLLAARQRLLASTHAVFAQVDQGGAHLVDHQLHPQFRDLVLQDEQHLVVVRRLRSGLLRGKQLIQAQVAAVGHASFQIGVDTCFQRALVVLDAHVEPGGIGPAW